MTFTLILTLFKKKRTICVRSTYSIQTQVLRLTVVFAKDAEVVFSSFLHSLDRSQTQLLRRQESCRSDARGAAVASTHRWESESVAETTFVIDWRHRVEPHLSLSTVVFEWQP